MGEINKEMTSSSLSFQYLKNCVNEVIEISDKRAYKFYLSYYMSKERMNYRNQWPQKNYEYQRLKIIWLLENPSVQISHNIAFRKYRYEVYLNIGISRLLEKHKFVFPTNC